VVGDWVRVGSVNFDPRSFNIHDEANIIVLDREFAQRQIEIFEADKAKSVRITLESYRRRSTIWVRLVERFYGLLSTKLRPQWLRSSGGRGGAGRSGTGDRNR
jgi:phosphatidylserine/phosphatidylglycerophosphate/cardiolipin synthase-like enzyme